MIDSINVAPKKANNNFIPKPYLDIAKGMEQQYMDFLIAQMRKSIPQQEDDSTSMGYYKSLLDSEFSKIMAAKNEGKGLQKIILDQVYPEKNRTKQNYDRIMREVNQRQMRVRKIQSEHHFDIINNGFIKFVTRNAY